MILSFRKKLLCFCLILSVLSINHFIVFGGIIRNPDKSEETIYFDEGSDRFVIQDTQAQQFSNTVYTAKYGVGYNTAGWMI